MERLVPGKGRPVFAGREQRILCLAASLLKKQAGDSHFPGWFKTVDIQLTSLSGPSDAVYGHTGGKCTAVYPILFREDLDGEG